MSGRPRLTSRSAIASVETEVCKTEMAERLEAALARNSVRYSAETYPAAHGWMKPDFPVYDHAAAERGWVEMLALFARNLRPGG